MPKRKLATRLRAGRGTLAGVATANFSGELSLAMVSPLIVNEGSQFGVTASRTGGASGDIAVDWRIVDVAGAIPSQGTFVWNNLNSTNQTAIVTAPLVTANDSGTIELYNPRGLNGTTAPRLGSPSSVALTVLNVVVNQPPAFTVAPSTATVLASGGTIQFTAADPEGLAITYSLVTPPSGYSINASTGLVTVAAGASGGSFIVRAADPSGLSVTTPCSVTIQQSGTNVPSPAVFPLELIYPRAAGTAPAATNVNGAALPGIPGTHRISLTGLIY